MLRPRPVPRLLLFVVKNGSNTRAITSGGMPDPVSSTASTAYEPGSRSSSVAGASVTSSADVLIVSVRVLRQIREQQLGVAENEREDVVEIVRDAAGELSDRFHLLRAEQCLARLLERFPRLAQLGHVVRDAEHAENLSALVAVDA